MAQATPASLPHFPNENSETPQSAPRELWGGRLLAAVFFLFSLAWALRIPIPVGVNYHDWWNFNPDEGIHIRTIVYMATHHAIAPHTFAYAVTIHPPLYYFLAALVYAAASPVVGMVHALVLLRLLSCLMGVGVVWLTYRTARLLASPGTALLAAGFVAGLPMFLSLSPEVSNENLSTLMAAATFFVMILGLKEGFDSRRTLLLALLVGAGILTKLTCLGLLPAAVYVLWWSGNRRGLSRSVIFGQISMIFAAVLVMDVWWFVRNQILYGAPVKATLNEADWNVFQPGYRVLHQEYHMSLVHYILKVLKGAYISFWGSFDAESQSFPSWLYVVLFVFQSAVCWGLWRRLRTNKTTPLQWAIMLTMLLTAAVLWAVFAEFNWQHCSSQGRYLFPLLIPFGLAMSLGWRSLFDERRRREQATSVVLAVLLLLSAWCFLRYSHRTWTLPANYTYPPKLARMIPPPLSP